MLQKRKISGIIEVEEINELVREGTTMPVYCRLQNGMNVVVKYMKNPGGQQVLINEFIGSNIADIIGLTIPEYGVCNLSSNVIRQTNYNEEIDERNAGLAFYTKYYSKVIPIFPSGILSSVINVETEKIILFDHLVNNMDRHEGNLICDISGQPTLYSIDNSHIITGEPKYLFEIEKALEDEFLFSNNILCSNEGVYNLLCTRVGYSEQKLRQLSLEIKSIFENVDFTEMKESIPECWRDSVGTERVNQMFMVLRRRSMVIEELAEMIIEERRKMI